MKKFLTLHYKSIIFFGVILLGFSISTLARAETIFQDFDQNGASQGIGVFGWEDDSGTSGFTSAITRTNAFVSSPYSLDATPVTNSGGARYDFATSSEGSVSGWIMTGTNANFESSLVKLKGGVNGATDYDELQIVFSQRSGTDLVLCGQNSQETLAGGWTIGTWYEFIIEWRENTASSTTEARCGYRASGSFTYSAWRGVAQAYGDVTGVMVYANAAYDYLRLDNFTAVTEAPCSNCTVETPDGIYTSPDYDTRFIDLNFSYTGNDVTLEAEYYLDPTEIDTSNPNYNVELIRYCFANLEDTPDYTCYSSVATTTGTTTNEYELLDLADGQYDVLINFYNYASTFTGITPFADTYIYSNFTIASGTVIQTGDVGIGVVSNTTNLGGYWGDLFDLDRQIFTRHPFAWIEDFLLLVIEEMTTEPTLEQTTAPLVTLELNPMNGADNMFTNDYGSVELDFFSEETVTTGLGEDIVALIRNVIGWALILTFMFGVWKRVMRMFNTPATV